MHLRLLVLACMLVAALVVAYRLVPPPTRKAFWAAARPHIIPVLVSVGIVIFAAVFFYSTGAITFS